MTEYTTATAAPRSRSDRRVFLCGWLTPLIVLALGAFAAAAPIHVAPHGNDAAPGTADEPLATLDAARRLIGRLDKPAPDRDEPITIVLHGGTYRLSEPFMLAPDDLSGSSRPVTIKAASNKTVRLVGSSPIAPELFQALDETGDRETLAKLPDEAREHVLRADLAQAGIEPLEPFALAREQPAATALYVNGQEMTLARWPNDGWARTGKVIDAPSVTSDGNRAVGATKNTPRGGIFTYDGDRPARWMGAADMMLHGFWGWDWFDEAIPIARIDTTAKRIQLAHPHHYGIKPNHRYYAVNLIEELDQPGEYYIDRTDHTLYFWPPTPLSGATIELTRLARPFIILRDVENVTIEGVTFEMARGDGIHIEGGRRNRVIGCELRDLGGSTIIVQGGFEHEVRRCEVAQVGRGGVLMSGGDRKTLTPAGHVAGDNHIHHFAQRVRTYQPALRLGGVGITASHNLIHDAPHNAILFGGNDHTIELNEIHDVCLDTGDVGVIYTGRDWTARGTVIRWNYIHDCIGPGMLHGAQGVYLDDCASGIEVTGNILHKTFRGMLIGGGRDNIIRDNLIVDSRIPVHLDARALGWMKHHVEDDGTLMVRLRAMPYRQPPWSERYPKLVHILDEAPAEPRGNILDRNVLINSGEMDIHEPAVRGSIIGRNVHATSDTEAPDRERIASWLAEGGWINELMPGFKPIPFERIGPRE